MGVNDNACFLIKRVNLEPIASKLSPTQRQQAVKSPATRKRAGLFYASRLMA